LGAVTPLGLSVAETWRGLLAGADAITPLELFDLGGMNCTQAGQIRGFTPPPALTAAGVCDRATGFAAAAGLAALTQAGWLPVGGTAATTLPIALVTATNFGAMDHGETALVSESPTAIAAADLAAGVTAERIADALGLGLDEGVAPQAEPAEPAGARQGKNSWGRLGYGGPAPPRGPGSVFAGASTEKAWCSASCTILECVGVAAHASAAAS
jgi:hypothetical protein